MDAESKLTQAGYTMVNSLAIAERRWWNVIFDAAPPQHASTNRYWNCFDLLEPLMTDAEYARTVRELWVQTGGLSPSEAKRRLRPHGRTITQEGWMRPDDAITFSSLPTQVHVFRGCRIGEERGWSWSLTRLNAESYQPYGGVVVSGTVDRDHVFALFSNDTYDEAEVIVDGNVVSLNDGE